jgi:predicted nuclease with TOPRIM domain
MNDLNETHSPSEITELLKQLRAENDALHEQVRSLHNENSRLRGEVSISIEREELLRRQLGELQNQLAFKGAALNGTVDT